MPSTYEPNWPSKYWIGAVGRLRKAGVELTGDDLETFKSVCDAIQKLSARLRNEGVTVGAHPNPLIDDMRDLENESLRVFQASGYPVTEYMWPCLSDLCSRVAQGVLSDN